MMYREITKQQANSVLRILIEECGYRVLDPRDGDAFVRSIQWPQEPSKVMESHVCREYRFCGSLGFGGKFRNNGNNENTPYVDCYNEDVTPARTAMIEAANKRLTELFGSHG